jgi:hypothetical protein
MEKRLFQRHVIGQAYRIGITLSLSLEHLDRKPVRIMETYFRTMSGLNENTKELCTVYVQTKRKSIELFASVFLSFVMDINIKDMKNICS